MIEREIYLRKTGPRTPRGSWRSFLLLQKWDLQTATPLPLARVPPFARFPTSEFYSWLEFCLWLESDP